ncbi:MAG: HAMP domain-containing histidine kinase [Sandaracinaceae bacterium]|nr:HAMP domain-containing histidine kinase [Sandaracinaceae bacterium]
MTRRPIVECSARPSLEERLHRAGPSLRVRVLLVLALVCALPLIVASVAATVSERDALVLAETLLRETRALGRHIEHAPSEEHGRLLAHVQAANGGRVRLLTRAGEVVTTVGESHRPNIVERVQAFLFGDSELPPVDAADDLVRSPALRDSFALARERGEHAACHTAAEGRQWRCHAIAACGAHFVLMERAERRTVGALVEQRYQLLRLCFFLLPWALLLGAFLSWRMIRPIEQLRREVDRRADMSAPEPDLPVTRKDELGALAHAFNRLAARLASRNREHEAFVADLAHEFKSPVAALRAASDKLAEGQHDPARLERLARVIHDSSERLQHVLDDFLELAHAETGWDESDYETVDIEQLARALVARAARDATAGDKRVELTVDDDALSVRGVPDRLEAALGNLLDNAFAFATAAVHVHVTSTAEGVHLTVSDDGPGIAPEDLPRVFDRFFTRRAGAGGTGLGLALVRAIIETHGGRVWAASEPGRGATFHVILPSAG